MDVTVHQPDDADTLGQLIRQKANAKQRDRYRVVQLAIAGQPCPAIMRMLGRSRGFLQRWTHADRDGGLNAIAVKPQPGRPTILPAERHEAFGKRVLNGPTPDDGVRVLRSIDMLGILWREFGVSYWLGGLYDLLHRLNLSVLMPRPAHRKADPRPGKSSALISSTVNTDLMSAQLKMIGEEAGPRTEYVIARYWDKYTTFGPTSFGSSARPD